MLVYAFCWPEHRRASGLQTWADTATLSKGMALGTFLPPELADLLSPAALAVNLSNQLHCCHHRLPLSMKEAIRMQAKPSSTTLRTQEPHPWSSCHRCTEDDLSVLLCSSTPTSSVTYPSSKCLHRFSANCVLVLHATHSNRSTIFLVVLAFLWNTGFV